MSAKDGGRTGLAWYLIYTKPQKERAAKENLARQGYEIYLPMLRKRIRKGRSYHYRNDPLFPRYLFIQLSQQLDDWGPIRSTIGVTHLVKFGDKPAALPDELISGLKIIESEEGVRIPEEKELESGERVRFIDGSMYGYEAIFECKSSSDRVLVLMDIAGTYTRLNVPASTIESTDE